MSVRARAAVVAAGAVVLIAGAVALLTSQSGPALPTVGGLHMPVARAALDHTLTIGSRRGVTLGDGTRLDVESRYGQFRGHWWWDRGWVYVSGQVGPGSQIHVHIDTDSLTITDTPDARAVSQVRRYGTKALIADDIEIDVVKFGIGAVLFATRTAGGPFPGRHVVDQLDARAWSGRGLTITRDQVSSTPADHIRCTIPYQAVPGWNLGCRLLGQPRLISDRRGRFPSSANSIVDASAISLTATPNDRTQLPADSLRVDW